MLLGHAQGALAMMMAARNVSINSNQFEILQLVGAKESRFEDTKILQFHPGQAICRFKVSSNGRVDGPEHKEGCLREVLQLHSDLSRNFTCDVVQ